MSVRIKRELFTQKIFDSGSLGIMTSVIHQFARAGSYQASVLKDGKIIGSFGFTVEDSEKASQLTIDLATVASGFNRRNKADDCNCIETESAHVVSSNGYVVFYASTGSGYSVRVGQAGDRAADFDSARLNSGDFFTLALLEPTTYSVINREGRAKTDIAVSFKPQDAKRLRGLEPVYVDVKGEVFKPLRIKLISTQGLIFRIYEPARIVVEKTGTAVTSKEKKPVYRWQKLSK